MDSNPLLQSIAQQVAPGSGKPASKTKLQFSIPCFDVDYKSGKPPSIYYMFYDLPFPQLPKTLDFNIVNGWIGGQGSGQYQEIIILKPDGSTHLASGQQKLEFQDENTPFMLVNFFPKIPFEVPGPYQISVRLNGQEVIRYPLTVRVVGQQGQPG